MDRQSSNTLREDDPRLFVAEAHSQAVDLVVDGIQARHSRALSGLQVADPRWLAEHRL